MDEELELGENDRLQYVELANKQLAEFDSRILWFSGGGLLGVLTFTNSRHFSPSAQSLALLAAGAVCLLLSSTLTLYSFQRSASDIASFLTNPTARFRERQMHDMKRLNLTSLLLVVVGLVLLGAFALGQLGQ